MNERLAFDDQVVIVTGAGRGLGRSHAMLLASRGANVVVNDLGGGPRGEGATSDRQAAREVVDEITAAGGSAVANTDDIVTDASAVVATALDRWGRVDALINNAGVVDIGRFPNRSLEDFERMFRVHALGTVNMTRAAWPHLALRGGRVVNTTSGAVVGLPAHSDYATAKGGVLAFTRVAAIDGRYDGVRVNAVMPMALTRLFHAAGGQPDSAEESMMGEFMPPELVSPTVVWLAHESVSCTGQVFETAGGYASRMMIAFGTARGAHTPEEVAANAGAWLADEPRCVPVDLAEQIIERIELLTGEGGAAGAFDAISRQSPSTDSAA